MHDKYGIQYKWRALVIMKHEMQHENVKEISYQNWVLPETASIQMIRNIE